MPLILAGRYLPEQPLARGGFGTTFIARDRYTPAMRRCVVKQLLPIGLTPQQMVVAKTMFEREGAVLEELGKHSNIPDLLAFFPVETGQEEFFYLVQEFIDGLTLEQVVEQTGAMLESEVLEMLDCLLPVLQFVHDSGSIHRDIKPSNIMVGRQDTEYYLLDFGAVKQITANSSAQRSTGIFTPGFGAPEQMRGDHVLPSSDLYALGVTCLYLLTGEPPEQLFDLQKSLWNWHNKLPNPVSSKLVDILDRMTANAPGDRFESAQAVLTAMRSKGASSQTNLIANPVSPANTQALATPPNLPVQVPDPVVAPQVQIYPQSKPQSNALILPPMGKQLFAAFCLGFESGILALVAHFALLNTLGLPSYAIALGLMLIILWLRASQILDNKDLLIFVNGLTILACFLAPFFFKLLLPEFTTMLLLAGITGMFIVALTAFARLTYQILYRIF
jgi:serine/threonine protein kinase